MSESPPRQTQDIQNSPRPSSSESHQDTRSPTAKAMAWVSSITSISVMMVIPAFGGYYLDQYFGTVALFLFLGMLLGIGMSSWQLFKLVQYKNREWEQESRDQDRTNQSENEL